LTETGRTPAREYLESNRYAGPAPVPIEQYVALVSQQRPREGWLTKLKANNGIYLIDDLGRQRATPAEVLNRWIVPMERRGDFLSFSERRHNDGARLRRSWCSPPTSIRRTSATRPRRRIQYKMLLRGPSENEFIRIFEPSAQPGSCRSRAT
jgi:hypothetical protein